MNRIKYVLFPLLTLLLLGAGQLKAPAQTSLRLYIKGVEMNGPAVEITYEITKPGFVELHLFSPEGEKIWIKGQVTDREGFDVIRIPRKPLEPGSRYKFILKYKGEDYTSFFTA
jgi:hypothetical protein